MFVEGLLQRRKALHDNDVQAVFLSLLVQLGSDIVVIFSHLLVWLRHSGHTVTP